MQKVQKRATISVAVKLYNLENKKVLSIFLKCCWLSLSKGCSKLHELQHWTSTQQTWLLFLGWAARSYRLTADLIVLWIVRSQAITVPQHNLVTGHSVSGGEAHTACTTLCFKKVPTFKLYVTLSNLNRFSKFLHCWKAYEICYNQYYITSLTLGTLLHYLGKLKI